MKRSFGRNERHPVVGKISEVRRQDKGPGTTLNQHHRTGGCEIHPWGPLLHLIKNSAESRRGHRDHFHAAHKSPQRLHGRPMVLQPMLGFRDRGFTGYKPRRNAAQGMDGPSVVDVRSIDGRLKRPGVHDDCSSGEGGCGLVGWEAGSAPCSTACASIASVATIARRGCLMVGIQSLPGSAWWAAARSGARFCGGRDGPLGSSWRARRIPRRADPRVPR